MNELLYLILDGNCRLMTVIVYVANFKCFPGGEGPYQNYFLEISDQNGKPLKLPDDERKVYIYNNILIHTLVHNNMFAWF